MLEQALRVAHVVVLGYWLGAELVINGTFRHVAHAAGMPFPDRDGLMAHVMDMDQHVRYALVLQASLGAALAFLAGYLPGGQGAALGVAVAGGAWLVLVEAVHRSRRAVAGRALARADRGVRYALMAMLAGTAALAAVGGVPAPPWLAGKLVLFAAVVASGLGIRRSLEHFFGDWAVLAREGTGPALEARIRADYWRATGALAVLWLLIGGIVLISVLRPG